MDGVGILMDQIKDIPLLTAQEERMLSARVAKGDERARNELVEHNMRLVIFVAKKFQGHGLPLEDLIQEGSMGLIRAAELYDGGFRFRFSTYAVDWIKQAVARAVYSQSKSLRVPERVQIQLRRIKQVEAEIRAMNGGVEPTIGEIAEVSELSTDKILWIKEGERSVTSLEVPLGDGEATIADLVPDESAGPAYEGIMSAQMGEVIYAAMQDKLTWNEMKALDYIDGMGLSLLDTAEILGIERRKLKRIRDEALAKLRDDESVVELRESFVD